GQFVGFETLHPLTLHPQHNTIRFYDWGALEWSLPPEATTATLAGHYPQLQAGDVLILQEIQDPLTGSPEAADPSHRQPVRLAAPPELSHDPVHNQDITEIRWHSQDALPFRLWVTCRTADGVIQAGVSVAL
ncbi:hypothetical protein, partial [Haemophilus parainfluenzae]|uniref:hypothetical protein n=1 Tax=Haemophilus parainfluenzae TaxID=729 RepID=UPI001CEC5278